MVLLNATEEKKMSDREALLSALRHAIRREVEAFELLREKRRPYAEMMRDRRKS